MAILIFEVKEKIVKKCENIRIRIKVSKQQNYLCDFVVRDIKIAVYLKSPRKINFDLISDFLSK